MTTITTTHSASFILPPFFFMNSRPTRRSWLKDALNSIHRRDAYRWLAKHCESYTIEDEGGYVLWHYRDMDILYSRVFHTFTVE